MSPAAETTSARTVRLETGLFWLTAVGVVAGPLVVLYLPFLVGERNYYHDSFTHAAVLGLFFDRLFSGDSWLWSSALNGGHPLWVSLEIVPIFDPVALAVYSVAFALGADWLTPYYFTTVLWMLVFATGGALCAHVLTRNRWACLLVFVLLFAGPLAPALPASSNGLLVPYRYFSLVLYFYLRLRRDVTTGDALLFSTALAFAWAGYQSIYPIIGFGALMLVDFAVDGRRYVAWIRSCSRRGRFLIFLIPLFSASPSLLWLHYTNALVPMTWFYGHWNAFFFDMKFFARDFLLTYFNLIYAKTMRIFWHGASFVGLTGLVIFMAGLRATVTDRAWRMLSSSSDAQASASFERRFMLTLCIWMVICILLSGGSLGLRDIIESEKGVFGVRNLGFLLPCSLVSLALIAGWGLVRLVDENRRLLHAFIDATIFVIAATLTAHWAVGSYTTLPQSGPFGWAVVTVSAAFLVAALLFRLLSARLGQCLFGAAMVAFATFELLAMNASQMKSLEWLVDKEWADANAASLVRSATPHFGAAREQLPITRSFEFPAADHWPLYLEGAAIFRLPTAWTAPAIVMPAFKLGEYVTHLFRLQSYEELVTSSISNRDLSAILGVSRPILELAPLSAIRESPAGLELVLGDGASAGGHDAAGAGQILDVDYRGDRVAVRLRAERDAMLVYRDNFAPGWTVRVDGQAADLQIVDRVNKAVALAAGAHRVEFVYRPWPYLIAFALRALVLVIAGMTCIVILFSARARRRLV